jgi:hypothetical protein
VAVARRPHPTANDLAAPSMLSVVVVTNFVSLLVCKPRSRRRLLEAVVSLQVLEGGTSRMRVTVASSTRARL